jgi:hypothetical protein
MTFSFRMRVALITFPCLFFRDLPGASVSSTRGQSPRLASSRRSATTSHSPDRWLVRSVRAGRCQGGSERRGGGRSAGSSSCVIEQVSSPWWLASRAVTAAGPLRKQMSEDWISVCPF